MNISIVKILESNIKKTDHRILDIVNDQKMNNQQIIREHFPFIDYHTSFIKDVTDDLPKLKFDIVILNNVFLFLTWKKVKTFIKALGNRLRFESRVMLIGPVRYSEGSDQLSSKNSLLESTLKKQDPLLGIRSFELINTSMQKNGFELIDKVDINEDDQCLVYRRLKFSNT